MYLHKVIIQNIRSIQHLEMEWTAGKEAGWHILIGDNGVGKSSVLRAISLALIGEKNWSGTGKFQKGDNWLNSKAEIGKIELSIWGNFHTEPNKSLDKRKKNADKNNGIVPNIIDFKRNKDKVSLEANYTSINPNNYNWGDYAGWFSAGFGTFRRLSNNNSELIEKVAANPRLGAHLSLFETEFTLTKALDWLKELHNTSLEDDRQQKPDSKAKKIIDTLKKIINNTNLLPRNIIFDKIYYGQAIFIDENEQSVQITEMSDGFLSVLGLVFELLRQLISVYGTEKTFEGFSETTPYIQAEGVVLIDEIDAHLHPSWQVKIGDWFLTHFPKIQFICTTHSPLICRACGQDKGQIWKLEFSEENGSQTNKLEDIAHDRLIFGNILDAYGTEVFGRVAVSPETQKLRLEKVELQNAQYERDLTEAETQRLRYLQTILPTTR